MSQYPVGSSGYVTLDNAKQAQPSRITQATENAGLRVYNDSGCYIQCWMDSGTLNEYLPAGAWLTWNIPQQANEFHWNVISILPNPPVQLMLITYYAQGEQIPEIPTLGNSPIGGAVQSSGGTPGVANQLINTGNPASSTPVIQVAEAGSTGNNLFADNQGNLTDSQYVGAVLTTLFRVIAGITNGLSNDNVLISDANHRTQVLGSLLIQALTTMNGGLNVNGQAGTGGLPGGINGYGVIGNIPASAPSWAQFLATNFTNQQAIGFEANIENNGAQNATGFDAYCNANTNGVNNVMFNARGRHDIPFAPNNPYPFESAAGSVGGQLESWPILWGTAFKCVWCYFRGLNTASTTIVHFPSAISAGIIWPGDISGSLCAMYNGTTAQSTSQRQIIYATTGGSGGSSSAQANIRTCSQFTFLGTANGFGVQTTAGGVVYNGVFIVGF